MSDLNSPTCPVCSQPVSVSLTKKANGLFLRCTADGKHYRGFIMDKPFVDGVLRRATDLVE